MLSLPLALHHLCYALVVVRDPPHHVSGVDMIKEILSDTSRIFCANEPVLWVFKIGGHVSLDVFKLRPGTKVKCRAEIKRDYACFSCFWRRTFQCLVGKVVKEIINFALVDCTVAFHRCLPLAVLFSRIMLVVV